MADPNASPDFDFGADPNLYTTTIKGKQIDCWRWSEERYVLCAGPGDRQGNLGEAGWPGRSPRGDEVGDIHRWQTHLRRNHQRQPQGIHLHHLSMGRRRRRLAAYGRRWISATGKILSQTADPQGSRYITDGFVSSANGVVYAGSSGGNFYAMDARTGQIK